MRRRRSSGARAICSTFACRSAAASWRACDWRRWPSGRAWLSAGLPSGRVGHSVGGRAALGVVGGRHSLSRRLVRSPSVPPAGDERRHHVRLRRPGAGAHRARPRRHDRYSRSGRPHDRRTQLPIGKSDASAEFERRIVDRDVTMELRLALSPPPAAQEPSLSGLLPHIDFYTARDGRRLAVACGTPSTRRERASCFCTASPATAAGTRAAVIP